MPTLVLLHVVLPATAVALVFALLAPRRAKYWRIAMIGVVVIGEIAAAYLSAPMRLPHTSCDDCPRIAGRYLDPLNVAALVVVAALSAAAGSYGGGWARFMFDARQGREDRGE
jgi:formate hydrogenlyase subunit 3/multisubunit Na+/H+ antiporter MnhD subunit